MISSKILRFAANLSAVVVLASGCGARQTSHASFNATAPRASAKSTELGRAELWAAHCTRCHSLRPATEYSPVQWSVIVNHMRTVADLPGADYRALLEYLADRKPVVQRAPKPIAAGTGAVTSSPKPSP